MKNVREMADMLRISKVSVYRALKRREMLDHVVRQGNSAYIDDEGERLLTSLFKVNRKVKSSVKTDESSEISFLREQNKLLTEKLAALAADLVRLNENSQTLMRENNLLKLPPPPEKVSLWDRLFKRKKTQ